MTRKRRWATGVVLVLAMSVPLVMWVLREIQIDRCLDAGGAWEYGQLHCVLQGPQR